MTSAEFVEPHPAPSTDEIVADLVRALPAVKQSLRADGDWNAADTAWLLAASPWRIAQLLAERQRLLDAAMADQALLLRYAVLTGELSKGLAADDALWDDLCELGRDLDARG